jgi:hypothetical protein
MPYTMTPRFHGYYDLAVHPYQVYRPIGGWTTTTVEKHLTIQERSLTYRFAPHFHWFVGELIRRLIRGSVRGLQAADTDYRTKPDGSFEKMPDGKRPMPVFYEEIFSQTQYHPSLLVEQPYPVRDLDFTSGGAYAVYNWELFYHLPITIAIHLSRNQRFDEAQRWFHYVFDPTDDSAGPTPERFWRVKPFQYTDVKLIEDILVNLSTGDDAALRQQTINSIMAWKDAPFRPHVVARYRQSAYMFKAVTAYLDNLIAWGDTLFRQDTLETVNEATQLYVLAAGILGPRPQPVPKRPSVRPQTYANLKKDLSAFGNAIIDFEGDVGLDSGPHPNDVGDPDGHATLRSLGRALYFCVPRNDNLLGYWDTVADRLFKIRNSLNILGVFRQLPLFEPPIDPALLARAAAAGLDIGAVVSGANQPLPLVRFQFLVQKAGEICQEVKSLGNNLLSAIEKEDNEALAILRAKHERAILGLAEMVRYAQWQEAIKAREGLEKSLENAAQRYSYYERLLGRDESDIKIPELDALNVGRLEKMKFKAGEPTLMARDIEVDIAQDVAGDAGGRKISSHEGKELNLLHWAQISQDAAALSDTLGGALSLIPKFRAHAEPLGPGVSTEFGGQELRNMLSAISSAARGVAGRLTYEANEAAKIGAYARREQEWAFQSNLAAGEVTQIFKQLRAAQIREAIAQREWKNHQQQIRHAEEIERFLAGEKNGKKANQALYAWMKREVKGLYGQCFQFAFDVAKKAERALQHELGDPNLSFLQFGYLAGKEGLLAGEKLYYDVKRMEMAYHDLNRREYELTKHVSLLQVSPLSLIQLRATGRCTFSISEEAFDLDCPGHYFRRIKSVAVSIPCVVGPYTTVNCTIRLLKGSIRKSPILSDGSYPREGVEDQRFDDHFGSLEAVVTSTGQNDSGMFETNLRDERYLPFEGSGVVGEWQLQLPADPRTEPRQFDYDTIADVILHVRYTAREGGDQLRKKALENVATRITEAQAAGSVRLFSVRHEFPSEWAKFKNIKIQGAVKTAELAIELRPEHYPFWSRDRIDAVKRVEVIARKKAAGAVDLYVQPDGQGKKDPLGGDSNLGGLLRGQLTNVARPAPTGKWSLYFSDTTMEELWLALTWGKNGT